MIKIMKNTSRNSVYFIVVSVLAILGITLASALSITKSTDVNVYPVILNTDEYRSYWYNASNYFNKHRGLCLL